jgi:tripartite-type tricarboxylate transporter receptor subunit TctC
MKLNQFAFSSIAAACCALAATGSYAADYPAKTITVVVPYSAGGGADNAARIIAQGMEAVSGNTVVIDNKPRPLPSMPCCASFPMIPTRTSSR